MSHVRQPAKHAVSFVMSKTSTQTTSIYGDARATVFSGLNGDRVMSTKEPKLQDFGITPEEYTLYTEKDQEFPSWQTILFTPVGIFLFFFVLMYLSRVGDDDALVTAFSFGLLFTGLCAIWGIAVLVGTAVARFKKSRLLASPVVTQIKLYEEAWAAYREEEWEAKRARQEAEKAQRESKRIRQEAERARRRELRDYWMSLDGDEFEQEMGILYRNLGYRVESTPKSGDQGIDLILRKNGKTTVVQCKSHKAPVGPAIVRELFGSMVAFSADNAILACTGGFTRGVKEFVRGKPIALISTSRLATLGGRVKEQSTRRTMMDEEPLKRVFTLQGERGHLTAATVDEDGGVSTGSAYEKGADGHFTDPDEWKQAYMQAAEENRRAKQQDTKGDGNG